MLHLENVPWDDRSLVNVPKCRRDAPGVIGDRDGRRRGAVTPSQRGALRIGGEKKRTRYEKIYIL